MDENKTYSQMRNEFTEKYQNVIIPAARSFEAERKNKLKQAVIQTGFFLILGLGGIILYLQLYVKSIELVIIVFPILFICAIYSYPLCKKDFEDNIKKLIMPVVCECFDNIAWSQYDYTETDIFSESNLIPNFQMKSIDDIFVGSYKDVKIDIVESTYSRRAGKNTKTVFDGVVIKLNMNIHFNKNTVIKTKNLKNLQKKFFSENDGDEINSLITPNFIERLNDMKTVFKADYVSCSFYKNYLLIALQTNKDLFSIGSLITPVDDSRQYFQLFDEILSIIKLIDHFKLDQKIGL